LAGDQKITALPRLVGKKSKGDATADLGYVIRVSTSFEEWDVATSDFIYFDVYNIEKDETSVMRVQADLFMHKDFDFEYDDMIGGHEKKAKALVLDVLKDTSGRARGKFIGGIRDYIDSYYMVRYMIII
jgi:hypothetical protein